MLTLNDFWIWIYAALGAKTARKLLAEYGSPLAVCRAGRNEWVRRSIVSEKEMEKAMSFTPEQAQNIASECERLHRYIILPDSEYYPKLLLQLKDYPVMLFVSGNPEALKHEPMIASVGTRKSTAQGEYLAYSLCKSLSQAGMLVVSGGALGIDSYSHKGALDGGTGTIAVLGCGFNCDYLKENAALRERISRNGALITEYLPDEPAFPAHFPERNRIIAGMCLGTVVNQAAEKSGALITANRARQQGREVFVFDVDSSVTGFSGSAGLINNGAYPISRAYDVLEKYSDRGVNLDCNGIRYNLFVSMPKAGAVSEKTVRRSVRPVQAVKQHGGQDSEKCEETQINKRPAPENLGEFAKRLYEYIETQPTQTDTAAMKAGLNGGELMRALTELELAGFVRQLPGNRCIAVG